MKIILCVWLLWSSLAQASNYPVAIFKSQDLLVEQGVCETQWRGYAASESKGVFLDENVVLWLVPCAQWAYNLAYTAYLEIKSRGGASFVKLVYFVGHREDSPVAASPLLYNLRFDAETKSISTIYYKNGLVRCGWMAQYDWLGAYQDFRISGLLFNDNCAGSEWTSPL